MAQTSQRPGRRPGSLQDVHANLAYKDRETPMMMQRGEPTAARLSHGVKINFLIVFLINHTFFLAACCKGQLINSIDNSKPTQLTLCILSLLTCVKVNVWMKSWRFKGNSRGGHREVGWALDNQHENPIGIGTVWRA